MTKPISNGEKVLTEKRLREMLSELLAQADLSDPRVKKFQQYCRDITASHLSLYEEVERLNSEEREVCIKTQAKQLGQEREEKAQLRKEHSMMKEALKRLHENRAFKGGQQFHEIAGETLSQITPTTND